jgi:hydrogenase/urease accessory protein HupE
MKFLRNFFYALACLAFFSQAFAHQVDSVEFKFKQTENKWIFKGLLDIAYMLPESRGVADAPPLFRKDVMAASKATHDRYTATTERTMRQLLVLKFNGKALNWKISFPDFEKQPLILPEETGGWALMNAVIEVDAQPGPGKLEVFWKDNLNSELILDTTVGDKFGTLSVFSGMSNTLLKIDSVKTSTKSAATLPSNKTQAESWLVSGFLHVLVIPQGLDHILFILGLFLLAPRWKPLLGQSLLFTLAHSITLSLAILGFIHLEADWIEILIAVSIAWIGIENLFIKKLKPSRLYLVFGFGLIHGMGFAEVLREKLDGISGKALTLPLLSFNIGVEIAQIALLICAFLILIPLKSWTPQIQKIGSLCIALAGLFWIYQRTFL